VSKESTLRSLRAHIGRLKKLVSAQPELLHHILAIERAIAELTSDQAYQTPAVQTRNPGHFLPNGRNLSDVGRAAIRKLYDEGNSIRQAAAAIGISTKSAADHRSDWLGHN
jgi:hypothetical protein